MNGPKAFIIGCFVLTIGLIIASFSSPATSQGRGGYMIASDGGQFVWRVNTSTGEISYCIRRDSSLDPRFIASRPPSCSAQTQPVQ
jgi:hypothetical protein